MKYYFVSDNTGHRARRIFKDIEYAIKFGEHVIEYSQDQISRVMYIDEIDTDSERVKLIKTIKKDEVI